MEDKCVNILNQQIKPIKVIKWKVKIGTIVSIGYPLLTYSVATPKKEEQRKLKSTQAGTVSLILVKEGQVVQPGEILIKLQPCTHPTIMNDMCAECGTDLRKNDDISIASVPMVHAIPDLKVSEELAKKLGKADNERLLKDRKLVLLVDLDQTLIHTTNDNVPPNIKDVCHFQLHGPHSPWYHTRLRPGTHKFLSNINDYFELHICTFGARNYAHTIAMFLDPDHKYFSNRILSRDECFDPTSKKANLKALFPCGDNMVCIIDDREDVWSHASNLIHVKPYHFFKHTGDINAPPGLDKHENDDTQGIDLCSIENAFKDIKDSGKYVENKEAVDNGGSNEESNKTENAKDAVEVEESKVTDGDDKKEDKVNENSNEKHNGSSDERKLSVTDESEQKISVAEEPEKTTDSKDTNGEAVQDNKELTDAKNPEEDLIDIDDSDDYLIYLEEILKRIHDQFYNIFDNMEAGEVPDLKQVIPKVRSKILEGCNLVFSGLVPTHVRLEQSKAYQVARGLGANVTQNIEDYTTHLVAVRPGTAKVNSGKRKKKLKIVTPDWLWCCAERWEHVDERIFPLNHRGSKNRHPPPHCSSPQHIVSYPEHGAPEMRKRTPSGKFMDTINPLMSFSRDDIADMDKEVEDILDDSDSSEEEARKVEKMESDQILEEISEERQMETTSSDESLAADFPRGHKRKKPLSFYDPEIYTITENEDESPSVKFRRGENVHGNLDYDQEDTQDSIDPPDEVDDGEWNRMGAELEREFLSSN